MKYLDKVVAETVDIEKKYNISRRNHVIITKDANIVLDIENEIIKGRILESGGEKEKKILEKFITKIGREKIYIHFYGKDNFLSSNLRTI